jgi:gliding motility-associated-like protein
VVDPELSLALTPGDAPCADNYLILSAGKFMDSYTVNFLQFPPGFDPAAFNPTPNGPFTTGTVNYGDEDHPVPFGTYEVEITDECGRTKTASVDIEFIPLEPSLSGSNNGCFSLFGRIVASVPEQDIVSATILDAPDEYLPTLPQDVSASITPAGTLILYDKPIGIYTIRIVDDCGFTYEEDVEIPPFIQQPFVGDKVSGCVVGFGGLRLASGNGALTSAQIVSGPGGPQDVSEHITPAGVLYVADLPAGTYVLEGTDICGIVEQVTIVVEGYNPTPANERFVFTPNCGSFSVKVTDNSNGSLNATYWLQRFDPVTQTWGHPATGVAYPAGTLPNITNSIQLTNNVERPNLIYTGLFRIVKKHETFVSGSSQTVMCIDENYSGEFEFTDTLTIDAAYTLACAGQPNDVLLAITGYPTSIQIIRMNGQPFFIDNGTNPLFTNLAPAEYTFLVSNACTIYPQSFNVQSLPSIATANDPGPMLACVEPDTAGNQIYDLFTQNPEILDTQPAGLYTITYHISQADADTGANPLPQMYPSTGNGQIVYARLIHNEINICYETTSFQLLVGETPHPRITTTGVICDDGILQLNAEGGFINYRWSNGATTRTIFVTDPGTYTVTADRMYGDLMCTGSNSIDVLPSGVPTITGVIAQDWTVSDNTITVNVTGAGTYEYSLDGVIYQDSNVFTGLETGVFIVYVRDKSGCGDDEIEVVLLNYPKFFTPNGDGTNDRWRIPFSLKEPHLNVTIFDRYGKLIIAFPSNYEGWDGMLNGRPLPSTDYWFVVTREDGREYKGHFSLVR